MPGPDDLALAIVSAKAAKPRPRRTVLDGLAARSPQDAGAPGVAETMTEADDLHDLRSRAA